ncbi:MAG: PAS domain S-box protein [Bacteroidetes bacterium]|nr:MAG: PAS domain S-box protein [Bacteroidota bacterium]
MTRKLVLCLLLFVQSSIWAQLYTFQNINHKRGLILSAVSSLAQDESNYLWIGTDGAGLQTFDGEKLSTIEVEEGQSEHHVTSIDPEKNGVYLSSLYTGFYCHRKGKFEKLFSHDVRFGNHLLIRKNGPYLYLIGSKKMLVLKDQQVVKSYFFEHEIQQIKQAFEIPEGLFLSYDDRAFLFVGKQRIDVNEQLRQQLPNAAFQLARFYDRKLEFFDFRNQVKCSVPLKELSSRRSWKISPLHQELFSPKNIRQAYNKNKQILIIDSLNRLFHLDEKDRFRIIPQNHKQNDINFTSPFIDANDDYWVGSANKGFFQVSLEPFTKIDLHPVYQNPLISLIYRSENNEILISDFNGKTYLGSFSRGDFKTYDIKTQAIASLNGVNYVATDQGIFELRDHQLIPSTRYPYRETINFIFSDGKTLYFSPPGKGLWVYQDGVPKKLVPPFIASHFYTAQYVPEKKLIYFGANSGIIEYQLQSKQVNNLKHKFKFGDYSGVSTRDKYGTCWFTYGKIIAGILPNGETVTIRDKKNFVSTIFYNLIADDYGNLFIGTNKGITKLNVNKEGRVLQSLHFNNQNGFGGYETHMRSQYKNEKLIFIGTIEGLFSINTDILENTPPPTTPKIFQSKDDELFQQETDNSVTRIKFAVINPKVKNVYYSYRLKGRSSEWSPITTKQEVFFSELADQDYVFEVKSTYDGINFSPIASIKIANHTPFWKSKWFLLIVILAIALTNVLVLDRSKSFELNKIIESQSTQISPKIRSIILAFGFIANTAAHFLAIEMEENLHGLHWLNYTVAAIMFVLFVLSVSRILPENWKKHLLHAGLVVILLQSYTGAYLSEIDPFYVVVITLATSLTPFILHRMNEVISYSVLQIVVASSIIFQVEHAVYNEILFILAVMVSVSLSIFTTYIRNESLQKLIFTSGIINRGNILAIAFDRNKMITYVSENSHHLLHFYPSDFLGEPLSSLNSRIHKLYLDNQEIDLVQLFQDDTKTVVPMMLPSGKETWIEWSCKVFSNSLTVVFGQDVSERVRIENNYEKLVENADDFIFYVDVHGNFVYVNGRFQEKLGYTAEELIGRQSVFLASEAYKQKVHEFYEKQFVERQQYSYFEFPVCTKGGKEIWVGQKTTLLMAPGSGKLVQGFLSLARDITQSREQQTLIEQQNKNIRDSISYAKTIQEKLLPELPELRSCFPDLQLLFKPRDIVSGDFYWVSSFGGKRLIALADCTGHGVPGSFMTLLGINFLKQIISDHHLLDPGKILNELDQKLSEIFRHSGNSRINDGMEICLIACDESEEKIQYACAGSKFITRKGSHCIIQSGESKHIGDKGDSGFSKYHSYEIKLSEIDQIVLFTDGITDQFSSSLRKKFSIKKLIQSIESCDPIPEEMIRTVEGKWESWKGDFKQTDDSSLIIFSPKNAAQVPSTDVE